MKIKGKKLLEIGNKCDNQLKKIVNHHKKIGIKNYNWKLITTTNKHLVKVAISYFV